LDEELKKYISCWSNCTLRHLEALAMIGLVAKADVVDCDRKGFQRIIVTLYDGSRIESACFYHEEVKQSLRIINIYIGFTRSRGMLGKIVIAEPGAGEPQ